MRAITPALAADFRHHYLTRIPKLAATHSKRFKTARQFFDGAVRLGLTAANPFAGVSTQSVLPDERRHYVSADPSPKTEHLPGKAYRVCPVFSDLARHLADAFDSAEPGEAYVVGGPRGARYRAAADTAGGGSVATSARPSRSSSAGPA